MKLTLILDISTGQFKRTATGSPIASLTLYMRDIHEIALSFYDGAVNVTDAVLTTEATMRVGVKTSAGNYLLAGGPVTFTKTSGVATFDFSLNTGEIVSHFTNMVPVGQMTERAYFEVEASSDDAIPPSYRRTYGQLPVALTRTINSPDDETPEAASEAAGRAETAATAAEASQAAALASQNAAAASEDAADADATQTAADRVQTTADAIATATDRIQTGLDRTQTTADAVATAADRVQTTADAIATAADAASADADATQTAADRIQTGLDRIQTGLDRTSAATSASNASASQTAAAASAALAAAIANYTTFKGTVASVPATSTAAGDLYLVSAAHTAQSITWAINDIAIYNGTSGSWSRVPGAIWMGMNAATRNALAPRGGLAFDGTANSRIFAPMGAAGAIGADAFSITIVVDIPAAAPSARVGLAYLSPSATGVAAQAGVVAIEVENSDISIALGGATGSDFAVWNAVGARTAYAGKKAILTLTRNSSGFLFYINGTAQTLTTGSSGGSVPLAGSQSISSTWLGLGHRSSTGVMSGVVHLASLYNLALSAADVLEIYELGGEVPERYKWSNRTNIFPSAGVFSEWFGTGTTSGETATSFTLDAGAVGLNTRNVSNRLPVKNGERYRFKLTTTGTITGNVYCSGAGAQGTAIPLVSGTSISHDIPVIGDGTTGLSFELTSVAGGTITVVSQEKLGAVAHYRCTDNTSAFVRDSSPNALHATRTSTGITPVIGFDHDAFRDVAMPYTATKQPAKYHLSDGATANRGLVQGPFVAGSRGWLAGVALLSWEGDIFIPAAYPGADAFISACPSAAPTYFGTLTNGVALCFLSGGFTVIQRGATISDGRYFGHTTFYSAFGGRKRRVKVQFFKGTTNPIVSVDNVDVSSGFVLSTGGTIPDWLDASMVTTWHLTGYNWPSGELPSGAWLNGHLTSAESLSWMITGQPPAWVQAGGHCANRVLNPARNSTFSAGATDWTTGATATLNSGYISLNFSGAGNNTNLGLAFVGHSNPAAFPRRIRATYTVSNLVITGSAVFSHFVGGPSTITRNILANGTYRDEFDLPFGALNYHFRMTSGTGTVVADISNVTYEDIGALSLLTPQAIPVAHDWTEIGGNDARCVGVRGVTDDPNWIITTDTTSAAAGGQAALGGDILDSTRDVIDSIVQLPTVGTPTTSVGHATGSLTTYKASGALASGINPLTLATRKLSANQLWIYQSTTDRLRTTIKGHRAN